MFYDEEEHMDNCEDGLMIMSFIHNHIWHLALDGGSLIFMPVMAMDPDSNLPVKNGNK